MRNRYGTALLPLLLGVFMTLPAQAQDDAHAPAISAVTSYFQSASARFGTNSADVSDLVVTNAYVGRRTGATHVYLRQAHNGIPIINAPAQAVVTRTGEVFAPRASFTTNVAVRVNAETPSVLAEAAASNALQRLQRIERPAAPAIITLSDAAGEILAPTPTTYPTEHFEPQMDLARLVYVVQDNSPIRLAWEVPIYTRRGTMWNVRVDATTGTILEVISWTDHDTWPQLSAAARAAHQPAADLAPVAPALPTMAAAGGPSYNVFASPAESPNHGPQVMTNDPANATASPNGWHDTGSATYTITRGNNAYAYEDRDANNLPGFSPDGGAGLTFDFPFDDTEQPEDYEELAITNLFYWNNIIHDVTYQYGFDEAAGNFQNNNFGNGGNGNDHVLAEAQDGSGIDNANFGTPPDGGSGRMQMFRWSPGTLLRIDAPSNIAGPRTHGVQVAGDTTPDWGDTDGFSIMDEVAIAEEADGGFLACEPIANSADVAGKIALIRRGECSFVQKVYNAQQAGAIAAIIHNCFFPDEEGCGNNSPGEAVLNMSPDPAFPNINDTTIPAMFVARSSGLAMRGNSPGVTVTMEEGTIFRDSDLDNGVILHEYTHGISNRLTGGPSAAGCLGNMEQMGEGWSDYYGLMLTQQPGDTAEQPRGIATYLIFEDTEGTGIRPAPYSTSFAVNNLTYGDIGSVSVPHGVGTVWSTMLWEMTWDLIAAHGYSADLYDADGGAGNQIALNLVTEGMKLQPCSPGFVDGRDGILAADTLLYGGAHSNIIWQAFARRGLGAEADQGSSASVTDGTEDFSLPVGVANEATGVEPETYVLSAAYPNPFSGSAQFTLEIGEPQAVRIEVFDTLGRRVALLHDGPLATGTRHQFAIDGARLASGIYTYRVTGETFTASERLTLLR